MEYVIGIDPGKTGAIAFLRTDLSVARAFRYPGDTPSCAALLNKWMNKAGMPQIAVIEKIHTMPSMGTPSAMTFGMNFGAWEGLLAAHEIPYILVSAAKWRGACFDSATKKDKDKANASLEMARRLFPGISLKYKADGGKADALHMARFGLLWIKGEIG